MQESGLRDLANPSVPASMTLPHDGVSQEQVPDLGPFQFVSGSVAQRMDVARSAGEFYARLTAIPAWQGMPAARAIQTALTSASPNPFAKWLGPAALLVMNHRNAPAVAPPNKLHQRAL